jgi:hypothetical protein
MRLVPVLRGLGIDLQRHRRLARGFESASEIGALILEPHDALSR